MNRIRIAVLCLALVMACAAPATLWAFDASQLRVNGFASQGYIKSDGNNYLVPESKDGSFDLNEVGITINTQVSDKFRIGAQILSRDFGDEANNNIVLDWGYGDFRFSDKFGLRAGLVKQPMGLYNETRDSDYLRPMAMLPQSVYPEHRRSYQSALQGIGIYGNFGLGTGNLEYSFLTGTYDVQDDTYDMAGSIYQLGALFDAEVTDVQWRNDEPAVTARVIYNTPVEGLRVGVTYNEQKGHAEIYSFGEDLSGISFDPDGPGPAPAVPQAHNDVFSDTTDHFIYSVEYATDRFTVAGEYNVYNTVTDVLGLFSNDNDVITNYLQVSVPVSSVLTVSALYDQYYLNKVETDDPTKYKIDTGIGLRYDPVPGFALKLEHHMVDGSAGTDSQRIFNPGTFTGTWNPPLDDDWSYSVAKLSFVF